MAAEKSSQEQPEPEDQVDRLFRTYDEALFSKRYSEALRIVGQLDDGSLDREARAIVAAMRAAPLLGLKREAEAQRQLAEVRSLAPTEPLAANILFTAGLVVERYDVAGDALDMLISRFPDVARRQDLQHIGLLLRNEPQGQDQRNEDRRIALARIGFGGDSPSADYLAAAAIGILMKRGDMAAAAELLRYVDEPQAIENMLIAKRFEPLWGRIGEHAGLRLEKVRASSVAAAQRAHEAAPNDHEALANLANALRHAGRLDEAIALRSKLPATIEAMSAADEQMGWAINNVALALHEAGRAEEADHLLAMLNDAPMDKEYWRVSMKINRLDILVQDSKFDRALPLIEPTARVEGSPYAEQLVRQLRYCTLSRLGRTADAAKHLPDFLAHASDAPSATIDGLLCAGELDKAEHVLLDSFKLTGIKKESFEDSLVRDLQAEPLTSDERTAWRVRWSELKSRPAVRRQFDRLGRDMPADFLVSKAREAPSH